MISHPIQAKYIFTFILSFISLGLLQSQKDSIEDKQFSKLIDSIYQIAIKNPEPIKELALGKLAISIAKEKLQDPVKTLRAYNVTANAMRILMDKEMLNEFLNEGRPIAENIDITLDKSISIEKANYYLNCSRYYEIVGPVDSSLYYTRKNLKVLEAIKDSTNLPGSYNTYALQTDPDSALYFLHKALDINLALKDSFGAAFNYGNIGIYYLNNKNDLVQTISNIEKSNEIFLDIGSDLYAANGYYNLALVCQMQADYDGAIKYSLQSLDIRTKKGDVNALASVYHLLGDLYLNIDRKEDALEYFQKALVQAEATSNNRVLPYIYISIGDLYRGTNKDSSIFYFEKSLGLAQKINDVARIGSSYSALGSLYFDKEKFELAESYLLKSLEIQRGQGVQTSIKPILLSISELYLDWFDKSNETNVKGPDLTNVEQTLKEYEQSFQEDEPYESKQRLYMNYSHLYKAKKNYRQQAIYQTKLIALQDSFILNRNIEVANEYAEKLKTSEKEKEIITLEASNKIATFRNRIFSYVLIGTVVFFSLLFFLFRRITRIRQKEQQLIENQKFRTRLSRNLHDDVSSLLNSLALQTELASLSANPEKKDTFESIAIKSRQAVQNMRDTVWAIDSSKDKYENLQDRVIEYAEQHLSIRDFKVNIEKFNWQKNLNILPEHRQNIYLIFKESITNILRHAKGDIVNIGLGFDKKNFIMDIQNNGETGTINKSGVGMESMKKRASEIGGKLSIISDKGFRVRLELPVQ